MKKAKVQTLGVLARRLVAELPADAGPVGDARVLPFAIGEHDDEYFALDLTRPIPDGDFPVLVCFLGRAEAWEAYPSSAAWIAADGVTPYG